MRKLVLIAVSALLVLSLAACGKADGSAAAMPERNPLNRILRRAVLPVPLRIPSLMNPTSSSMRASSHRRLPTTIPVPSSCRTRVMMTAMATTGPLISKIKRMTKLFALSQAARP